MNPFLTEVSIMTITSPLRSFVRSLTGRSRQPVHPDAEPGLTLPRRIDDPATAARISRDLLRHWKEDVTLALYLDDRHRLVGSAIVAVGRVQAARLSARPILQGSQACRATGCILVRFHRFGPEVTTDAEESSYWALASAAIRHGLVVMEHVVVAANGEHRSTLHERV
jgi:DNA repair protein RadC